MHKQDWKLDPVLLRDSVNCPEVWKLPQRSRPLATRTQPYFNSTVKLLFGLQVPILESAHPHRSCHCHSGLTVLSTLPSPGAPKLGAYWMLGMISLGWVPETSNSPYSKWALPFLSWTSPFQWVIPTAPNHQDKNQRDHLHLLLLLLVPPPKLPINCQVLSSIFTHFLSLPALFWTCGQCPGSGLFICPMTCCTAPGVLRSSAIEYIPPESNHLPYLPIT